eukprot:352289-Karenia_brevis.AAC.1
MLNAALLLPCHETEDFFHHVYREENADADALATLAHVENLEEVRVTTTCAQLRPFGQRLVCSFDGSLRGQYGAGGWTVFAERCEDIWVCVAHASFPIAGAKSSTASEIMTALSLL